MQKKIAKRKLIIFLSSLFLFLSFSSSLFFHARKQDLIWLIRSIFHSFDRLFIWMFIQFCDFRKEKKRRKKLLSSLARIRLIHSFFMQLSLFLIYFSGSLMHAAAIYALTLFFLLYNLNLNEERKEEEKVPAIRDKPKLLPWSTFFFSLTLDILKNLNELCRLYNRYRRP